MLFDIVVNVFQIMISDFSRYCIIRSIQNEKPPLEADFLGCELKTLASGGKSLTTAPKVLGKLLKILGFRAKILTQAPKILGSEPKILT